MPLIEGLDYSDPAIAVSAATAAPLLVDLLPVPPVPPIVTEISVRIAFLLLAILVYMSERFGLEVVLGAFLAGAMVSLLDREKAVKATGLQEKLEGIGFGIFIPSFFVVQAAAARLVAGGVISVLLFPALALRVRRPA